MDARLRRRWTRLARALPALAAITGCATSGGERAVDQDLPGQGAVPEAREARAGVVVSDRHFVLSSDARVTVAAPDSATARAAIDRSFAAADSVETLLSLHDPDSEVSAINRAAGGPPVAVSPWTEQALAAALLWAERSGGAFDPTIGPMIELWGFGRSPEPDVPSEAEIAAARRLMGWQQVRYDSLGHTVSLPRAGMVLDLRGLAKGFALDRMREAMRAAGATSAIMDLDDDVLFFGPAIESGLDRWTISLPDPYDPEQRYARLEMPPGAVSTSAALDRAIVIRGQRYGHLIDPRTGRPVQAQASVSAYAADGVTSDILATALYVLGPMAGPRFVEQWPGVEAAFVTEAEPRSRSVVILTTGMERWTKELVPPYRPLRPEDS